MNRNRKPHYTAAQMVAFTILRGMPYIGMERLSRALHKARGTRAGLDTRRTYQTRRAFMAYLVSTFTLAEIDSATSANPLAGYMDASGNLTPPDRL